jgi:hypothetical protein
VQQLVNMTANISQPFVRFSHRELIGRRTDPSHTDAYFTARVSSFHTFSLNSYYSSNVLDLYSEVLGSNLGQDTRYPD